MNPLLLLLGAAALYAVLKPKSVPSHQALTSPADRADRVLANADGSCPSGYIAEPMPMMLSREGDPPRQRWCRLPSATGAVVALGTGSTGAIESLPVGTAHVPVN